MKPQIVFYDAHVLDQDYFRSLMAADFDLKFTEDGLTPDSASLAVDAQVISVHVSSPVTAGLMSTMPKLRHVSCRSTGYDNVDLEYAAQHDITVSTVPSYGEATVASQ